MWVLWSVGGNDLHLIFMEEREDINYFYSFIGIMYMPATVSWCLGENTELLAKILAVIVIFINKGILHKNNPFFYFFCVYVTLKYPQQTTFLLFALFQCHTIFLSPSPDNLDLTAQNNVRNINSGC